MTSNSKHSKSSSVGPSLHWARFSVDGSFAGCSEWLHARWTESGLLEGAGHARDFFYLSNSSSEAFFNAWVAAVKGSACRVDLRLAGRERSTYSCRFAPELDRLGEVAGVQIEFAESALPEDEALLDSAFRSTSAPFAITDDEGGVCWANHALCSLLELDGDEIVGKNLLNAIDPEVSDNDREQLRANLASRCEFQQVVRKRLKGGLGKGIRLESNLVEGASAVRFVVRCSALDSHAHDLGDSVAKIEEVRGLFREVSGTNAELERALDRAREEIETMRSESEAKSDFLANMSHEIRTPMNAVIGFCDLLLNTRLDDEQSEYVEAIFHSGQLLIQLIGQVLDYSKIDSGHLELLEEEVSLGQIMLEVQAIMGTRLRSKDLEFRLDCANLTEAPVLGDATRIKQILVNLLGNAYKFTRSGHIGLDARTYESPLADHVCLRARVEDSGIGIESIRLGSLFNPFAQANSRIAKDYGGTGLGLAICKRLCQAMSGDIWVESTSKARGTVFCFEIHLPLSKVNQTPANEGVLEAKTDTSRQTMEEKVEEHARKATTENEPMRVLVVDDNPNNLLITSKLSEHLGYEAKTVRNGLDAIEKLKEDNFDIVLMDVRMAPINGMETTRMIRKGEAGDRSAGAYIIALTAHALQGDREKCLASGMNDYLSKPLTLEKLEESLSRARSSISLG